METTTNAATPTTAPTRASSPIWLMTCDVPGIGPGDVEHLMFDEADQAYVAILSPQGSPSARRKARRDGRSIQEIAEEMYHMAPDIRLAPAALLPGEYHPRIWRNGIAGEVIDVKHARSAKPAELVELRQRVVALHRIQRQLADVFEVVTPNDAHRGVAGEAIGQILALAAFEVERLLREAYVANCSPQRLAARDRLTMGNFSALAPPMRLAEWAACLEFYDEWGEVRPFVTWTGGAVPAWWTAYNRRKHDPAGAASANLENMIACVVAVRVLLEAEFGPVVESLVPEEGIASIRVTARPTWSPEELYFPPTRDHVDGDHRPHLLFR